MPINPLLLSFNPDPTADFFTALQALPDWLQERAVVMQSVQKLLNRKIAQRFPTGVLLSDFFVQNDERIEGFPAVDFFFNAKIRQARVFFKLENANSILLGNNNFTAPNYPYRDFVVRFGIVWDFFL